MCTHGLSNSYYSFEEKIKKKWQAQRRHIEHLHDEVHQSSVYMFYVFVQRGFYLPLLIHVSVIGCIIWLWQWHTLGLPYSCFSTEKSFWSNYYCDLLKPFLRNHLIKIYWLVIPCSYMVTNFLSRNLWSLISMAIGYSCPLVFRFFLRYASYACDQRTPTTAFDGTFWNLVLQWFVNKLVLKI